MTNLYDLIPDIENLQTLFIMESPHFEEIDLGIPCVGVTGKRMSEVILKDGTNSFGNLLKIKDTRLLQFGIMNSFPFPLGINDILNIDQTHYAALKKLNWEDQQTTRKEFYMQHYKILGNREVLEQHTHFKKRLNEYIQECPILTNLVFCGFISQAVYQFLFNKTIIPYNSLITETYEFNREMNLLYVNHPSEKNPFWNFNFDKIKKK